MAKSALLCAPCAALIAIAPGATYAGKPAPTVHSALSIEGAKSFTPGTDLPRPVLNIPPISEIPAEPLIDDKALERFKLDEEVEPGWGVFYNPETGEELEMFMDELSLGMTSGQGGGYDGADGGGPIDAEAMQKGMAEDMYQITALTAHPWRMNVKVLMHWDDGSWSVCSGTMRDAETVLTAGHCVFSQTKGWADEIYVLPGYDGAGWGLPPDDSVGEYGWGRGTYFGSWSGWTEDADWDYDVGLIGVTRAVGVLTGWYGWSYGGSCSFHKDKTYHNPAYPSEGCGQPGLHNGLDMYYWYGNFDSCPGDRLEVDTDGGCFNAIWGGMSGSGAYYIDGDSRYVHGMCSTSNRSTYGRYSRQWDDWVSWSNSTFIPNTRGSTFDLQPLRVESGPASIEAGQRTESLKHLAVNPTNGTDSGTWEFDVYLSSNDNISTSDTNLGTQTYTWDFSAVSSVTVNMGNVTIPANTPAGDYWLGLVYADGTDGNIGDNDSDGWDAAPVTITARCELETVLSDNPTSVLRGGSFTFTAAAENDCDQTRSFDEAVMAITGPATLTQTLYSGADIAVSSGQSTSKQVRLNVPTLAPIGSYTVKVTLSLDGDEVSSDSFGIVVN